MKQSIKLDVSLCSKIIQAPEGFWTSANLIWEKCVAVEELLLLEEKLYEALILKHNAQLGSELLAEGMKALETIDPDCIPMYPACALGVLLPDAMLHYQRLFIGEDIMKATFGDIVRWIMAYARTHDGILGVDEISWITHPYAGSIFEIGSLQYQPIINPFPVYVYKRENEFLFLTPKDAASISETEKKNFTLVAAPGLPTLNLHIPTGTSLLVEDVNQSIARAKQTFAALGLSYSTAICYSWILDEMLASLLPQESKLLSFSRRFVRIPFTGESTAGRYLFSPDYSKEQLPNYTPVTSLQKKVKEYLLSGGELKDTAGILLL